MKKIVVLVVVLFMSVNWCLAQDTLYIYKGGVVVAKRVVTDIDSITFYRPHVAPAIVNSLTGGVGVKKTWVLDISPVATTIINDAGVLSQMTEYKSLYFHNPIDFYGDAEAGAANGLSWGPWGGVNLYDWGQTPELGEISFDAGTGMATSTIDGITKSGKYSFNTYNRDPNFCILTSEEYGGQTLWINMLQESIVTWVV